MNPAVVSARRLRKSYGDLVALDDVSFDVRAGECFGFLGPNGAGKSTTMKMIYGLAAVGDGELRVLGHDVAKRPREVKARVGVVPQSDDADGELTVRENLLLQAHYHGMSRRSAEERADELLLSAGLGDRADASPSQLSGGMRRRLLIARALVGAPDLVVLDEPTTALDPQARLTVWNILDELRARGVTLLLTTHYMDEATRLCDRLVVMDRGRVVAEGSPRELMDHYDQPDLEAVFLHLTGHDLDA